MKRKLLKLVALSVGVIVIFGGCSADKPATANLMTVKPNISVSDQITSPAVNDSITAITLDFSEELDSGTVSDNVKLYKLNSDGSLNEEACTVNVDSGNSKLVTISKSAAGEFAPGEEYKIEVGSNIQSKSGVKLEKEYIGYFTANYKLSLSGNPELNSTRSQIIVISDIHLGIDDRFAESANNKEALADFLNQVKSSPNVKELVIAGDLLDGWFLPMDYVMPESAASFWDAVAKNNQVVVDAINAIIHAGDIKVTYVSGNHDLLLTQADAERIFPGINQARDEQQGLGSYITGTKSEIVIEHGHKYNIFVAPDPISNRDITNNNTSILPPGYFYTRIATSSIMEGYPKSSDVFPVVTAPDKSDAGQYSYYIYYLTWKGALSSLPVNEKFSDKVIKTNIDGFTKDYSINDLIPYQDSNTGTIDVNLYKDIYNNWEQRQRINGVKTLISADEALAKAADDSFTDYQSKMQYFDLDASKRIVVFGHSHLEQLLTYTNLNGENCIYANSGTWIDKAKGTSTTMNFVVITQPQSGSATELVNVYKYSADKNITQLEKPQAISFS